MTQAPVEPAPNQPHSSVTDTSAVDGSLGGEAASYRRPLVGQVDEERVGAPSKNTVIMLGVICVSTVIMWAMGRAACNYHEPGESLTPRQVPIEERVRTPKGTALEFAQALTGADFEVASSLASGEGSALVEAGKSCGACKREQELRASIFSVADVLSANRDEAYVAVTTVGGPLGRVERVLHLGRPESAPKRAWRVIGKVDSRAAAPQLVTPSPQVQMGDGTPPLLRAPEPPTTSEAGVTPKAGQTPERKLP